MHTENVNPVKRVKKMVKNSTKYKARGHNGTLNQGGPHIPPPKRAKKRG